MPSFADPPVIIQKFPLPSSANDPCAFRPVKVFSRDDRPASDFFPKIAKIEFGFSLVQVFSILRVTRSR